MASPCAKKNVTERKRKLGTSHLVTNVDATLTYFSGDLDKMSLQP